MKDGDTDDLELTPALALQAYSIGVFPMAERSDLDAIYWVDPRSRGVLPLDTFHVSKRLRRKVRQGAFDVRTDTNFDCVIEGCAAPSTMAGREDTWINPPIARVFRELHSMGHAHSVECWLDGELVGGLYGLALGGAFFGESMFSQATDASKVALVHLAARLTYGGFILLDSQFPNPHLNQFGAEDIGRAVFRRRLDTALDQPAQWPMDMPEAALHQFLDRPAAPPKKKP